MIQNKESTNDEAVTQSEKEQGEFPAQEHIVQIKRLRKGCSSSPKKELNEQVEGQTSSTIALDISQAQPKLHLITKVDLDMTMKEIHSPSISKSVHDGMISYLEDQLF